MNDRYTRHVITGILGALVVAVGANGIALGQSSQPAPRAAKDIFYRLSDDPQMQTPQLALNYKILLKHGETATQVPSGCAFKSGDCFRLVFQTNTEGYVYLLHKGSTGNGRFLFPDPRIDGGKNHVTAYQEHIVPAAGWFSFDENQGMETIHVIVTNRLLPELLRLLGNEEIQPSRWERVVETFVMAYRHLIGQRQVKDIVYVEAGQEVSHLERPVTQQASQALAVDLATETSGSSTLSPRPSPAVQSGASTAGSSQVATTQPAGQTEAHTEQPSETPADSVRAYETSQVRAERTNSDGAGNHTVQTFVAQAGAMAGEQNVLVHTISLNHR